MIRPKLLSLGSSVLLMIILGMVILNVRFADAAAFRVIPIPTEEHGYHNFETMVIASQNEMDRFMENLGQSSGWNNRADFEKALGFAKVDFGRESLVLVRYTEGLGSVRVDFSQPVLRGRRLVVSINRITPEWGTDDMAYFCFALAVDKNEITEVEVKVSGQPSNIIRLPESPDSLVMCSADAKLCPDGSYVSRVGPDCRFADCQ